MTTPTSTNLNKKVIQLTTKQGCLMVVGLVVVFGSLFFWVMSNNSTSIDGGVTLVRNGQTSELDPFGCLVERVNDRLTVALQDKEPKDGFHNERRAIILQDTSTKGESSTPRPVEGLVISYRQEDDTLIPLTCAEQLNTLTIRTARRTSRTVGREDRWNGEYKASCTMNGGTASIELEMKNCD